MRSALALLFVLFLSAAALAGIWRLTAEPGLPDAAQTALAQYLAARYPDPATRAMAAGQARAARPEQLDRALAGPTYGDGVYFGVQHLFRPPATAAAVNAGAGGSQRPLPYPPEQVWCLRLVEPGGAQRQVLLARFEDLYVAAWVVTEPPAGAAAAAQLGCPGGQ